MAKHDDIAQIGWDADPVCSPRPFAKEDRLHLEKPWNVYTSGDGFITHETIPAGFDFEGSVPWFGFQIITPSEPAAWAAWCFHDWRTTLLKIGIGTLRQTHRGLYLALRKNGVAWWRARIVWVAVWSLGWYYAKKPLTDKEKEELKSAGYRFAGSEAAPAT